MEGIRHYWTFDEMFSLLNPFMSHCTWNTLLTEQSNSHSVIDSAFHGLKWAHSMVGISSSTDNPIVKAVRAASKRVLGIGISNRNFI